MKKNFFKWAVVFTALATALSFSSCGDDDDENEGGSSEPTEKPVMYSTTLSSINVEAGKTYVYNFENIISDEYEGEFTVKSAEAGKVVLEIKGNTVELSDAGASYLSTDFKEMKQAEAVEKPKSVLFCLLASSTNIASATMASNTTIAAGANEIYFAEK